ncbi:MAG: protein kinase, partial [Myxococcota bacterium]
TDGLPVLPGYRVKKKLDEGGCGQLWLATKRGDATWWVIKTLRPDLARRPDIVRRFEREIRILAELDHPHVVRVQGARRTQVGHLFTVMEFIRGLDFERILYHFRTQKRLLPPDLALRVTLDVLSGLHAAHELSDGERLVGVVHRDLSPRNLMVDADGTTKVIDFGLAAAQISPSPQQTRADVGTPRFWSPEQAQGRTGIDRRSDIYAIAVILYEALTGRAVSPFAELGEIRRSVINDRLPLVHTVVTTLPERLGVAIGRALSKAPEDRFDSADAFAHALRLAWGERPIRTHAAVADFLRRDGPSAYRTAAEQSPMSAEELEMAPNANATFDGPPSDLMQDLLHPPTKLGAPAVRPPRRLLWFGLVSVIAVVLVAIALTMTTPQRPPPRTVVSTPVERTSPKIRQRTASPELAELSAPTASRTTPTARKSSAPRTLSTPPNDTNASMAERRPKRTRATPSSAVPRSGTVKAPKSARTTKPVSPNAEIEEISRVSKNGIDASERLKRLARQRNFDAEATTALHRCLRNHETAGVGADPTIIAKRIKAVIKECGKHFLR